MLPNRDNIGEDEFQCELCTDLCYLSMIICNKHHQGEKEKELGGRREKKEVRGQQMCIHHYDYCKCPISSYTLVYRYSSKELEHFKT